jgi:poly-gamma-glutamate synthesis protein (capsule biosynthesis protein)
MNGAKTYVESADYAVANLETTLAGGPNYSGYPSFNSPDALAESLKDLGFDLVMTSNNHSLDKGKAGLMRTLDVLDQVGLAHVGTSRTQEEYDNNIQVADVGGISVAFLAYTYGTNGISVPNDAPYIINLFNKDYLTSLSTPDTDKLTSDLAAAQALDTDLIAVMIHWGIEYQTTPNSYQQEMADFLLENGADLVLGGHSHVPQSMEMRTVTRADGSEYQGFVCYSLGNFISAQNDPLTDTTAVLTLDLTKDPDTGETTVTDYTYHPMLMLDREEGPERYELLDVQETLAAGDISTELETQLQQALADCAEIWGSEHMAA